MGSGCRCKSGAESVLRGRALGSKKFEGRCIPIVRSPWRLPVSASAPHDQVVAEFGDAWAFPMLLCDHIQCVPLECCNQTRPEQPFRNNAQVWYPLGERIDWECRI